ncbi:hypothetical protein AVEN_17175-1, partial [Araneus ventricosus]
MDFHPHILYLQQQQQTIQFPELKVSSITNVPLPGIRPLRGPWAPKITCLLFTAVVETAVKASEYADLVIDEGSPVNADMVFDKHRNHLYVMTEKR